MKKIISISAVLLALFLACVVYAEPLSHGTYAIFTRDITAHSGEQITMKAQLVSHDHTNEPIAKQIIKFYISDDHGLRLWGGEAMTDYNGKATIQCTAPTTPGKYNLLTVYIDDIEHGVDAWNDVIITN